MRWPQHHAQPFSIIAARHSSARSTISRPDRKSDQSRRRGSARRRRTLLSAGVVSGAGHGTLRYGFAPERRRASPTSRLPRQVICIEGRSAATAHREEARDLETGRICYLAIRLLKAGLRASQRSCQETVVTHSDLLVVDDDDSTRIGLTELLANAGFTVDVARDGAEALDKMAKHDFSVVLLDVHLPRIGGLDVLARCGAKRHGPKIIDGHGHHGRGAGRSPWTCVRFRS